MDGPQPFSFRMRIYNPRVYKTLGHGEICLHSINSLQVKHGKKYRWYPKSILRPLLERFDNKVTRSVRLKQNCLDQAFKWLCSQIVTVSSVTVIGVNVGRKIYNDISCSDILLLVQLAFFSQRNQDRLFYWFYNCWIFATCPSRRLFSLYSLNLPIDGQISEQEWFQMMKIYLLNLAVIALVICSRGGGTMKIEREEYRRDKIGCVTLGWLQITEVNKRFANLNRQDAFRARQNRSWRAVMIFFNHIETFWWIFVHIWANKWTCFAMHHLGRA